jgi:oxygen-independent coproporphyrinogen-3 oxidase
MQSEDILETGSPYTGYLYGYPHKTAYRRLDPPLELEALWAEVDRSALFLYVHVPFCEMRCGFCNLFTQARPKDQVVEDYLGALGRQVDRMRVILSGARFARIAVGGGTPTYLTAGQLERLFDLVESMGADPKALPASVETSPETAIPERLQVLARRGVERVSIGVQSFDDGEVHAIARPQSATQVDAALARIRAAGIPTLNVDLMYGLPGQRTQSFLGSIRHALHYTPEELYLYPLYVRPLTGLGRKFIGSQSGKAGPPDFARLRLAARSVREDLPIDRGTWDAERIEQYREGRSLLLSEGYRQVSMRMFRREDAAEKPGPAYRCQEDGMVGLGAGARSYTERAHYSTEYAVGARGVKEIIEAFIARSDFDFADYGFLLDDAERKRRHVILSLLERGVSLDDYRRRFGTSASDDFPELAVLVRRGLARPVDGAVALTDLGVERSDHIGPWLHSDRVRDLMAAFDLR